MSRTLKLTATRPQMDFHNLGCKYPLFVGGFGSGKTETMLNQAIIDAALGDDALIALYAPTYDLVKLILMPRLQEKLANMNIKFTANKSDYTITTHEKGIGNFILRTLDRPERIIGYQSHRAHVDELDTLKLDKAEEAWNKIIARNRQILKHNKASKNRVSAYTTPEGFNFAYDRWIKRSGSDYAYVTASSRSNPFLPKDYIKSLIETYPEELVKAYIEGQFVNLIGGNVYSSYNRDAHRSDMIIRPNETLFIGCDFNVTKQAATIFVKRNGGKEWHAVYELVDMYDTPEMIAIIKAKWPTHEIVIYPDASGKSRKTVDASISDIGLLEQAGFKVRVNNSNPAIRDRIMAANAAFSHGKLFINDINCPTVANCLEQQAYDKNGEPDKKSGKDHQNDATTYPIAYEMPIVRPVAHIPVDFYTHT